MTEHTPGPWSWINSNRQEQYDGGFYRAGRLFGGGDLVVEVTNGGFIFTTEANARLIAAAPETAAERDRLREINAELLWLAQNQQRYLRIQCIRDQNGAVASFEKEFVAAYERRQRAAIKKAESHE